MAENGLIEYCGSTFWDINLTWNTSDPYFTPCFEKTVLVWTPCGFLWLFAVVEIYSLVHSRCRHIPWTALFIAKMIVSNLIIILCLVDLVYASIQSSNGIPMFPVDLYTPIIKGVTVLLSLIFMSLEKTRGIRTSGTLFIFWLLMTLCSAVSYRTVFNTALDEEDNEEMIPSVTYLVYFPLVLAQMLLHCWADDPPNISEEKEPPPNLCPEQSSSFLSRILFSWFSGMAWLGYRRPLKPDDLWSMNLEDRSRGVVPFFEKYWEEAVKKTRKKAGSVGFSFVNKAAVESRDGKESKHQTSILPVLFSAFGVTFFFGSVMKLLSDTLMFVNPQIFNLLISFVDGREEMWRGYLYAASLFLASIVQSVVLSQYFLRMFLVGLRIRTALISAIYKKALRLSNTARKESTVGEIVNLMSVDAQRLMELTQYINLLWSAPLQIILALVFLWDILGPSVLAGVAVMVILIPLNGLIANKVKKLQVQQMKYKDERVKLMNEVLNGIKVLKLYAWELSFEEEVKHIRNKEVHVLKIAAYLNAGISFVWTCAPFIVTLASFGMYVLVDERNVLTPQVAFVCLSLFNIMRMPMTFLPMLIVFAVQAGVSLKRINKFLNADELDPANVSHDQFEDYPILMENCTFSWSPDETPVLRRINLQVSQGQLVAIVGSVGAGKSSLISGILGDMEKIAGRVNTKGSMSYVPQQAWIQNCTLKDNILFGKPIDDSFYNTVVDACALRPDLEMLPGGDTIEIGEKGINLSGGQKQRVSLARAVYSDADLYFLDDPLSAVDTHVGKHIFQNVIGPKGLLKKKTRLLVTHGITYLPEVDHIVVLKEGEVSEEGTYRQLLAKRGHFAAFLMEHLHDTGDLDPETESEMEEIKNQLESTMGKEEFQRQWSRQISIQKSDTSESELSQALKHRNATRGSFMEQESREDSTGSTSRKMKNLRKWNSRSSATSSIRRKSADMDRIPDKGEKLIEAEKTETGSVRFFVYLHYMKAVGSFTSIITILLYVIYQGFSVGSNIWLSVWSSEPAVNGTQDIAKRDMYLGVYGALGVGQALFILIATMTMSIACLNAATLLHKEMLRRVLESPMSFFDTTPLGRIINRFAKDVDVMDNTLPMNIRGFLNTLFSVLATIVVISYSTPIFVALIIPLGLLYYFVQRVYVSSSRQLKRLESISRSPIYSHFGESISGAPTIRAYRQQQRFILKSEAKVDYNQVCYYPSIVANRWLAIRLELVGNLIILFSALFAVLGRETMDAGLVGLSVSYALQVTQTLNWMVRMTSDVETNIVAVERVREYGEIRQEAPWEVPEQRPPPSWPSEGRVAFNGYKTRYREGLDLVLKEITCDIKGGEKVGIVGRTGAGKSSLTLALFRIIEASGGSIIIDGENISKMGLHDLRAKLTIIPQDPVLFSGTLRSNLDPFRAYSDEEVWRALEHAHLRHFAKGLPAGLSHDVTEGGDNLSVGQRQLICLARALLRKTKVLILDEATAAVDLETDDLIQKTIREQFKDGTVITIAHRLNTIMDSTRVMVLDLGQIKEFDSPQALLDNKDSIFFGMARDAGLVKES